MTRDIDFQKSTGWVAIPTATTQPERRIRARYGFHYIAGNRQPHFAVTGEIAERRNGPACDRVDVGEPGRWTLDSCGCIHGEIEKYLPDLKPLIPWHLADQDGTPMHYEANGVYHYELHRGWSRWTHEGRGVPLEHFKSTIVFGAVEGDDRHLAQIEAEERREVGEALLRSWLSARLPALREAFLRTMKAHGIELVPEELYKREEATP